MVGSVIRGERPVPAWLRALGRHVGVMDVPSALVPPADGGARSAVLVLVGEGPDGPDILFVQRARTLRLHAGEAAFPGGTIEPADPGPVEAALREAAEEVGIRPNDVDIVALLPELYIPPTDFRVAPVLAWWARPGAIAPGDPREVAAVDRVSFAALADPACRLMLHRPEGIVLPAFLVDGTLIWGMTATVVDRLLALAGWERPWDARVVTGL